MEHSSIDDVIECHEDINAFNDYNGRNEITCNAKNQNQMFHLDRELSSIAPQCALIIFLLFECKSDDLTCCWGS